jgi:hypothetical protein
MPASEQNNRKEHMKQWMKLMLVAVAVSGVMTACTSAWSPVQRTEGEDTYHVNPALESTVSTAKAVNAVITPEPAKTLVGAGLSLTTAILGAVAAGATAWATARQRQNNALTAAVNAVIAGVEQVNNKETKEAISTVATATGAEQLLDKLVRAKTE